MTCVMEYRTKQPTHLYDIQSLFVASGWIFVFYESYVMALA
jgi:hypothetical protein